MDLNFRYFFICLFFITALCSQAREPRFPVAKVIEKPKKFYHLKKNIKLLKQDYLLKELREFVRHSRPSRIVGSVGHKKAANYLIKRIREIDPDPKNIIHAESFKPDIDHAINIYKDDFKREIEGKYEKTNPLYKKWSGFTKSMTGALKKRGAIAGKNIVWQKTGRLAPDEILVIGAHYDTIANDPKTLLITDEVDMPGADDNGSGVSIALGMIHVLSRMQLPKTVRVVFFDWEELGFLGSRAYVKKHLSEFKKKKFLGFVNLEMLGHDSKFKDSEKKFNNMKLYIRRPGVKGHEEDESFAERLVSMGKKSQPSIKFDLVANSFNSSDHINFWENGLRAVTFTQNWETDFNKDRYHSPNDFVETVNARTLHRAYTYISGAVGSLVFDFLP